MKLYLSVGPSTLKIHFTPQADLLIVYIKVHHHGVISIFLCSIVLQTDCPTECIDKPTFSVDNPTKSFLAFFSPTKRLTLLSGRTIHTVVKSSVFLVLLFLGPLIH